MRHSRRWSKRLKNNAWFGLLALLTLLMGLGFWASNHAPPPTPPGQSLPSDKPPPEPALP